MKTDTISPEESFRKFYPQIAHMTMCSGIGDGKTTACVMAQAATLNALRKGESLEAPTDEMECACPVLRRIAIRLNDGNWWKSDDERTESLRPLIPMLLDSSASKDITDRRMFYAADNSVRVLTPIRLEFIGKHTKSDDLKAKIAVGVKALRELPEINSKESAKSAADICAEWKRSASAYAYAYAYASADAYAYASAQRIVYREMLLDLFKEIAAIK